MNTAQERNEECRREVRRFLAERSVLAHRAETIRWKVNLDNDFTVDEVLCALTFLVSDKQVDIEPEAVGATLYYKINAKGTLAHERGR